MAREKMITRVVSESVVKVTWYDGNADCLVYSSHLIPELDSMKKPAQYIASTLAKPSFTYVKHDIIETHNVKYSMPLTEFCERAVRGDKMEVEI